MMKTTTVILTRDSEQTLARALRSAVELTDSVLVMDTGSADSTRNIVAEFPDVEWRSGSWHDSFSRARNEALDFVQNGLVVFLDSDEWVEEGHAAGASLLRGLDGDPNGCWSPVVHDVSGLHQAHNLPRILRAEGPLRFRYRVHERLFHAEKECWPADVPLTFWHDGYTQQAHERFGKQERNLHLLRRDLEEHPGDPHTLFFWLRDGLATRDPEENRDLVRRIDQLSAVADSNLRRFPVLARKVVLADEWQRRGAHPDTVRLARDLANLDPRDADAVYVLAIGALIESHREMRSHLQELAELRSSIGDDVLQWGLSNTPRHLDAAIAEYLRTLGDARASDFAKELVGDWNDAYFENSRRRGLP